MVGPGSVIVPLALSAIRTGLRLMPPKMRERTAVRLFMKQYRHPTPERELDWMERGTPIEVAGLKATRFGEGPVALLMHGWQGRGLQMCNFIDPLLERGYCVIALDGPNHGQNEGGLGALPTFSAFMEDAIAQESPALIIGHSLGAAAAIVAASRSGYEGTVLCLGGPPDTEAIFDKARHMMGLPDSGLPLFMEYLGGYFEGYRTDDVMDLAQTASRCKARLLGVLGERDDDIPPRESQAIIEAGGGRVVHVDSDHRSVMWDHVAVEAGLDLLDAT